jgi:hypothetical protein
VRQRQRAGERHRLHRVVVGVGPRRLSGREHQLRHRMQRQVCRRVQQLVGAGHEQRGQRAVVREQRLDRLHQRARGDAVLGVQAAFERMAQLPVEQLALQRDRHRLVARPQLRA